MASSSGHKKNQKIQKPLVSVIIVSWNGLDWLKHSLPSLQKVTYNPFETILVDNASTDGTLDWVKSNYPHVQLVSSSCNNGFAQANNIGFQHAKGDYILFLNNDVEVAPEFIEELVKVIHKKKLIAGAQSKILLMDNKKKLDSVGAFLTAFGFLYHHGFMNDDSLNFDKTIYLYTPKGASMMFKRSVLENVKIHSELFDSEAFAYFEETDLAHRIWLSGQRIVYAPMSIIYHKMGGTSTSINNSFIQYHSFKNRIASYIKNLELGNLLRILPLHLLCCEVFALLYLSRRKINVFISIQTAIIWNIRHILSTLRKRKYIQSHIRRVPDAQYFPFIFRSVPLQYYISQASGKPYEKSI